MADRRKRARGVRVRTTIAALVVVGAATIAGALAVVAVLRQSLTADMRAALQLRAADIASALAAGTEPQRLTVDAGEDSFVQVLGPDGVVLASSANIRGLPRVATIPPDRSARVDVPAVDDDGFLVVADAARTPRGTLTVLAGRSLEIIQESTGIAGRALTFGVPGLLLIVGATAWLLVGRALRPVDDMRTDVDAITASGLDRRIPDPGTGDEIARLAATMNDMLARLEASQTRQRRFVSDASHELRSPIATIRQHAELALAHPEKTSSDALARTVLGEEQRLEQLVADLLFLARADEGSLRLGRRAVDLDDLVLEEAGRLRALDAVHIDTAAVSAGRILGDASRLRRLIRNLTDNATRHAEQLVALSLAQHDGDVVLRVDDDGPGIPEQMRGRVFERFVRLDDARGRAAGGTGLGLAIAAEITAAHDGTIRIGDSDLGGARVEVRFPASA